MIIIEIKESNYQDFLNLDIVAFLFAYGGAMGEGGAIYIVDREGHIYHTNYCYGKDCIDISHIKDVIPVYKDMQFGIFGSRSNNEGWDSVYLGFGNHLFFAHEYKEELDKKVEEAHYDFYGQLFQDWPGFILGFLGKEECNLTMNDIWKMVDLDR